MGTVRGLLDQTMLDICRRASVEKPEQHREFVRLAIHMHAECGTAMYDFERTFGLPEAAQYDKLYDEVTNVWKVVPEHHEDYAGLGAFQRWAYEMRVMQQRLCNIWRETNELMRAGVYENDIAAFVSGSAKRFEEMKIGKRLRDAISANDETKQGEVQK